MIYTTTCKIDFTEGISLSHCTCDMACVILEYPEDCNGEVKSVHINLKQAIHAISAFDRVID